MPHISQDPTTAITAAALAYARRGWPVLLLQPGGKAPLYHARKYAHGVDEATTDENRLRSHLWRHAGANVGIACGRGRAPVTVQDVDDLEHPDARAAMAAVPAGTPTVRTPGEKHPPGLHFYFAGAHTSRDYEWGELRSGGLYVVVPPSVTDAGAYVWTVAPNGTLPALPPALTPPADTGAARGPAPERTGRVPHGQRHNFLKDRGRRLVQSGVLDEQEILVCLLALYEECCDTTAGRERGGIERLAAWLSTCDIAERERNRAEQAAKWKIGRNGRG